MSIIDEKITALDRLVSRSFTSFYKALCLSPYPIVRESEARNIYAFGHLAPLCKSKTLLYDPTQISLDAPVPALAADIQRDLSIRYKKSKATSQPKRDISKDLVLWQEAAMTTWSVQVEKVQVKNKELYQAQRVPLAIMEWKFNATQQAINYDLEWLEHFSAAHPNVVGYSVTIKLNKAKAICTISIHHSYRGITRMNWQTLS